VTEVQSGEGPWRITYNAGIPVMVEIWVAKGQRVVVGIREHRAPCARCGQLIECVTPDNDEMDVCEDCYGLILAEVLEERQQ